MAHFLISVGRQYLLSVIAAGGTVLSVVISLSFNMCYLLIGYWYTSSDTAQVHPSTGCSINIVFFPQNFVIYLNSASSAAALVFHLPGVCAHTLTPRENRERPKSGIFLKIRKKHNTLYIYIYVYIIHI